MVAYTYTNIMLLILTVQSVKLCHIVIYVMYLYLVEAKFAQNTQLLNFWMKCS